MAKEDKIELGDSVKIGSSPIEMTVNGITNHPTQGSIVTCIWFDKEPKMQSANIALGALTLFAKKGS